MARPRFLLACLVASSMAVAAAFAPSASFAASGKQGAADSSGTHRNLLQVTTKTGTHKLTIELAVSPSERERGLMGRQKMAADHGMLFDFGSEQPLQFWMKDTPLSLDMIFIKADGRTSRIERATTPFSERLIPSGAPVRYVLELVAGSADRLGLAPGDRFTIPKR